jgi:HEAT repeat protein
VTSVALALVWVVLASQDDPAKQARDLVEKLRSNDVHARDEATRKLKALGKAALPALEGAAKDADAEVVQRARGLLRVFAVMDTLTPNLMKCLPGIEDRLDLHRAPLWTKEFLRAAELQNGSPKYPGLGTRDLESLAIQAIRGMDHPEMVKVFQIIDERSLRGTVPELARLLKDPKQPVRFSTVQLLGKLAVRETAASLIPLLKDPDPGVGEQAAEALGSLGGKEAVPALLEQLKGDLSRVGRRAAEALGKLRARDAIPELMRHLKGRDPEARRSALQALGTVGAPELIPDLVVFLKDPDPRIRSDTVRAFRSMKARDAVPEIEKLLQDSDAFVRRSAVSALADLGARDQIRAIAALLDERGADAVWIRGDAVRALGRLAAREEIPRIAKLLNDEGGYVRGLAADALAQLKARDRIPEIVRLLQDGEWTAVSSSLKALAELGAKEEIPRIGEVLRHESPFVRTSAIHALVRLGARGQAGEIVRCLSDPGVQVRLAAAEALCYLGLREGVQPLLQECADLRWPIPEKGGNMFIGKSPRALNALRDREAWSRLQKTPATAEAEGSRREAAEKAARSAGLTIEWSPAILPEADAWISGPRHRFPPLPAWTLSDELASLVQGQAIGNKSPRYEILLDGDRIRIVTYDEALQFWRQWADEQKK